MAPIEGKRKDGSICVDSIESHEGIYADHRLNFFSISVGVWLCRWRNHFQPDAS